MSVAREKREMIRGVIALAIGICLMSKWGWDPNWDWVKVVGNWNWFFGLVSFFFGIGLIWYNWRLLLQAKEEKKEEPDPERRIEFFLQQQRQIVYAKASYLLGCGLLILASLFAGYFFWPWSLLWCLPIIVGLVAAIYFIWSSLVVNLSELGWWFVKVPEMTAALVMYFDACRYVIMCVNNPARRQHFERLVAIRRAEEKELGEKKVEYILLPPGQGVYFLGLTKWPWQYKLKGPWYQHPGDQIHPKIEPIRYLPLNELSWNLLSVEHKDQYNQPGILPTFTTNDPIDVIVDIIIRLRVFDPYLAVFGQPFVGEAIVNQITARLRRVVANLRYLQIGSIEEADIKPQIQQEIHQQLIDDLGIKGITRPEIAPAAEDYQFVAGYDFDTHRSMELIFRICGYDLADVEISDLNPIGDIMVSLADKARAGVEGSAAAKKAVGLAAAAVKEAEGYATATVKRAEADKTSLELRSEPLKTVEGRITLNADVARAVAAKVGNIVVLSGDQGGEVGRVTAIQAALQAVGGLPVKEVGKSQKDNGDSEGKSEKKKGEGKGE